MWTNERTPSTAKLQTLSLSYSMQLTNCNKLESTKYFQYLTIKLVRLNVIQVFFLPYWFSAMTYHFPFSTLFLYYSLWQAASIFSPFQCLNILYFKTLLPCFHSVECTLLQGCCSAIPPQSLSLPQ